MWENSLFQMGNHFILKSFQEFENIHTIKLL